jgi:hypothetical protein
MIEISKAIFSLETKLSLGLKNQLYYGKIFSERLFESL